MQVVFLNQKSTLNAREHNFSFEFRFRATDRSTPCLSARPSRLWRTMSAHSIGLGRYAFTASSNGCIPLIKGRNKNNRQTKISITSYHSPFNNLLETREDIWFGIEKNKSRKTCLSHTLFLSADPQSVGTPKRAFVTRAKASVMRCEGKSPYSKAIDIIVWKRHQHKVEKEKHNRIKWRTIKWSEEGKRDGHTSKDI